VPVDDARAGVGISGVCLRAFFVARCFCGFLGVLLQVLACLARPLRRLLTGEAAIRLRCEGMDILVEAGLQATLLRKARATDFADAWRTAFTIASRPRFIGSRIRAGTICV